MPLDRFRTAQDAPHAGYATALSEIGAGRKTTHWIWYVFPQLRGLGQSSMSHTYGIADVAEARAYLRDPVLGARLAEITRALEHHVCDATPPRSLTGVLGGIDATKVVSSLTLFAGVARAPGEPALDAFVTSATRVLDAAVREGLPACGFTQRVLNAP